MINAIQAVAEGVSKKSAAKTFGVPRATLIQKINNNRGRDPSFQTNGRKYLLNESDENEMVNRLINIIDIVKNKQELFTAVNNLANRITGEQVFIRCRPSEKWMNSFLARHPELKFSLNKKVIIIINFSKTKCRFTSSNFTYSLQKVAKKTEIVSNPNEFDLTIENEDENITEFETSPKEFIPATVQQEANNGNEDEVKTKDIPSKKKKKKISDFDRYLQRKVCLHFRSILITIIMMFFASF